MDLIIIYDDGHNNSISNTSSERRQMRRKRIRKHNNFGRRLCYSSSVSILPFSSSFLLSLSMIITCCCTTCTNAFPTYLTSGSGCYKELDVDEVIMNSNVVSYEDQLSDSTKPKMNIVVNGHVPKQIQIQQQQQQGDSATSTTSGGGILQLSYFPINLNLQVLPDMTISGNTLSQQMKEAIADYQYIIDIIQPPDDNSAEDGPPDASFDDGGMCERKHRISGRGQKDSVSIICSNTLVPVKLVAGWAAGHEAVKLTPMLTIQQHPWTRLLSTDCQRDSLDVTVAGRYRFVEAALKLHVSEYSGHQQTNSYIVKLLGNSNIETLVLDCNQQCIFTSGGVGKVVCDGRRVILDAVLLGGSDINIDDEASSWPVAVIHNDHEGGGGDAFVSGLYSIATEPEIRRTKTITLPHSKLRAGGGAAAAAKMAGDLAMHEDTAAQDEHQDEQQKQQHRHLNDPQKDVDERARYNKLFDEQVNKRKRQEEEKEKKAALAKAQPNFFGLLIILVLIPIIIIPVYYWVFIASTKNKKLWKRRGNTSTRRKIT